MLAALLCLVLLPMGALASTWKGATTISGSAQALFQFAAADTTTGDSAAFRIINEAIICFDPDTAGVAGTGEVVVRRCNSGAKPSSNPQNSCISTGGSLPASTGLTGVEGASGTQNACEWYGAGVYYIDITTQCGGDNCQVSITGSQR
jgi:hypothetical protein